MDDAGWHQGARDDEDDPWARLRTSIGNGARVAGEKIRLGGHIARQALEDSGVDTDRVGAQLSDAKAKVASGARRVGEAVAREAPKLGERVQAGAATTMLALGAAA